MKRYSPKASSEIFTFTRTSITKTQLSTWHLGKGTSRKEFPQSEKPEAKYAKLLNCNLMRSRSQWVVASLTGKPGEYINKLRSSTASRPQIQFLTPGFWLQFLRIPTVMNCDFRVLGGNKPFPPKLFFVNRNQSRPNTKEWYYKKHLFNFQTGMIL